jgi:hypothetical protein
MRRFLALGLMVLLLGGFVPADAQAVPSLDSMKSQEELTRAITALDKQLFDAYNTCNIERLGTLVTDDLEFYHDKTGLAVGKQPFLDAIKKNICGKVTRELVAGIAGGVSAAWLRRGGDWSASLSSPWGQ